jgi:uncharacterized protein YjdB
MSKANLRRGLSLLLSLLLVLSISPILEMRVQANTTGFDFVISSNLPFADSEDSTSNPYLMVKQGTNALDLEILDLEIIDDYSFRCEDIDSTSLYWVQINNNLDFEGVYLSKVTINGVSIEIPETCTIDNHSFLYVENEIAGIDSRDSIYSRNFDYTDVPGVSCIRGYLLAFSQIVPDSNINILFEFGSAEAQYAPEFRIALGDEEKARINGIKWVEDTDEGSVYEVMTELLTSPYDPRVGNYDFDYYTIGEDDTHHVIPLTFYNYRSYLIEDIVKGYWTHDEEIYSDYWTTDINGEEETSVEVRHYYISVPIIVNSDSPIDLHFCDSSMELSLVSYRADSVPIGEHINFTKLINETIFNSVVLSAQSIPLIEGMDGFFEIIVSTHGLYYCDGKEYQLTLYNGDKEDGETLVNYAGVTDVLLGSLFSAVPAEGYIWFTALELPKINKITIEMTWAGYELSATIDVKSAEDIPQVQEFMSYYQETYGLDKFGRETYTATEKESEEYALYERYSPYRYFLRDVYNAQLKAISMAGDGNYGEALVSAKATLASAAHGEGCDTVLWAFQEYPSKGTTARPMIAAMPRDRAYLASDAIEAVLEANWPGNWTYNYTATQFGAFVTNITAGGAEDTGSVVLTTNMSSYGLWYINGEFSNWGVSNYDIQDGDVMAWGNPDPDFTWNWAILRWKLGDEEIERVLALEGIAYESTEFNTLGADGLAALFPASNYPGVEWCQYGQFSRYGQLRELAAQEETIRLINAIGDVSPQSGDAIAKARASYNALDADTQALVSNYDVLLAAEAAFAELKKITDAETVREAIMASLAADPTAINVRSVNGEWKIFALARDGRIDANSEISQNYLRLLKGALARDDGTIESLTDYERVTFALSSLGIDASSFQYDEGSPIYDLTALYSAYDEDLLLNQKSFGLLAMNAKPYSENTEAFVNGLVSDALDNGGWNIMGEGIADADMTADVLIALAPYYASNDSVRTVVDEALVALRSIQDQNAGGFSTMGQYNSCSIAQVIVALCSLGIDPTSEAWTVNTLYNPITALCQFFDEDAGMIKFTLNASEADQMSTEQAAYALAAYARLKAGKATLYDMADAFDPAYENGLTLAALKTALEGMTWDLVQESAGDADAVKTAVEALLTEELLAGAAAEVTVTSFEAATEGTAEQTAGTNGSYTASIALSKGEGEAQATETVTVTGTITATEYTVPGFYFTVKSNVAFGSEKTGTEAPYLTLKVGGELQELTAVDATTRKYETVIDSSKIYLFQVYNDQDLADLELKKITINGVEVTVPESSTSYSTTNITGTFEGLDSWRYFRTWRYEASAIDSTTENNRGFGLTFNKPVVSGDIEIYLEYGEKADPAAENAAALASVKTALEGMTWDLVQESAGDADAVKTAVEALLTEDLLDGATAEVTVTSFEAATEGTAEQTAGTNGSYAASIALSKGEGEAQATEIVTVIGTITATPYTIPEGKVLVTFRLVGSYPAEQDVDLKKSDYRPDYVTWIPTKTYLIDENSTMYDLFIMATNEAGLNSVGADSNYVKTIYAPEILTGYKLTDSSNGKYCGWMYTVNGVHSGTGLQGYKFSADESVMANRTANVVWHYVNDYRYETSDWASGSLGDETYWDKWLEAPDVEPTAVPAASIELDQTTASLAVESTLTLTATVLPTYAYDKTAAWSSSDDSIATVADGVVTGVKPGTATITAKIGELTAVCTVSVKTVPIEGVALDLSEATIEVDGTVTLAATVSPENATDKTVTWSSSDESVATVADGVVTGVKAGTATITAKAGEETATCVVTVKDAVIAVTKVTLDKTEASVEVDGTVTLAATVSPENATDKTVTWSSSDKNIATVKDGKVMGVKAGTVTITAKAGDKTATCLMTVTEKAPEEVPVDKIIISEADGTPVAAVTSAVENNVATLHVEADRPCIVVVKVGDTYERLEATKNGNGYDFSVSGYSGDMEFYVLPKGDVNGDGIVDGSDVTKAKAAYLGKTTLDELGALAADINGDGLDGSDITKMKAAYLGKTTLDW